MADSRNESAFRTTAAAWHEENLNKVLFAERAAKTADWEYVNMKGFKTLAQASRDILHFWNTPKLCRESHSEILYDICTQRSEGNTSGRWRTAERFETL